MTNSIQRFNRKAHVYQARPSYPFQLIDWLVNGIGFSSNQIVADVGCGTGLLAEIFLKNGNRVYGMEPNSEMREIPERYLMQYPQFTSVDGTAEQTTLENHSIDLITVGQAFHWFDAKNFKTECQRIVKPSGKVLLVWNTDTDCPALKAFRALIKSYQPEYTGDGKQRTATESILQFFGAPIQTISLPNQQLLDPSGFINRACSSSYAPNPTDKHYNEFCKKLDKIFAQYQQENRVTLYYETRAFIGTLP